jgi:signal transduction histidine kinase
MSSDSDPNEVTRLRLKVEELERDKRDLEQQLLQVDRERVEYLQNVSHQLVAPLNAIKWHIENLTEQRIGIERARKVLRSIYSQSTIAVHLAKNFALMSNLDADRELRSLQEPLQEVALCPLLINLADDFQPLGWDREINISVEKERFEEAPPVLAIKPLVSQVFSNIIENAVKYSNDRTSIVIDGDYDEDDVTVNIRNRGIALPEDRTEIFSRGYRSVAAKNKYPAGTGFGLYIAKRIVEIHEGDIAVSVDDAGRTVFSVMLSQKGLEGKARFRAPKDRTSYR